MCAKHSYENGGPGGDTGEWKADSDLQPQLDLQGEASKTSMAILKQDQGGAECWRTSGAAELLPCKSPQDSISQGEGQVNGKSDLSGAEPAGA